MEKHQKRPGPIAADRNPLEGTVELDLVPPFLHWAAPDRRVATIVSPSRVGCIGPNVLAVLEVRESRSEPPAAERAFVPTRSMHLSERPAATRTRRVVRD